MSVAQQLSVEPAWILRNDTASQVDRARLRYVIRLAALFDNEDGNISRLSTALGFSSTALHMAMKRGQVTAEVAVALENRLGRHHFPRELFRPDLFTLPAE